MKRGLGTFLLLLAATLTRLGAEDRAMNIDLVLLVDTSLSMDSAIEGAKDYLSTELLEPLLLPGDRLILESFYGKVERVFSSTIRDSADRARALAALAALRADGRFTDIGSALDRAEADLAELGGPERPKYVLLATDERQEAPVGTKYYSPDYRLKHPALSYVKRLEFGPWRLITVGFGVAEKVEAAAGALKLLVEAPRRRGEDFPPLPSETPAGLEGAFAVEGTGRVTVDAAGRGAVEGTGRVAADAAAKAEAAGGPGGAPSEARAAGGPSGSTLFPLLIGAGLLAAVLSLALLLKAKRSREKERHEA